MYAQITNQFFIDESVNKYTLTIEHNDFDGFDDTWIY